MPASSAVWVMYRDPLAVVVLPPITIHSRVARTTPALLTLELTPLVLTAWGSKTCQLDTMTLPWVNNFINCCGTRSRVRYRLASLGVQFPESVADRDVGADDQHDIGEPRVGTVVDLVEDAPGRQHAHDGRLACPGGHLAGVAEEAGITFGLLRIAWLIPSDGDALAKVAAGLSQKDDRLGRLALSEEEPPIASVTVPPVEQLQRRPGHPGITLGPPLVQSFANEVDELELDGNPEALPLCVPCLGVAVEIDRLSPPLDPLWLLALDDVPVLRRRVVGRIQNGLGDFVSAHDASLSRDSDMVAKPRLLRKTPHNQ